MKIPFLTAYLRLRKIRKARAEYWKKVFEGVRFPKLTFSATSETKSIPVRNGRTIQFFRYNIHE